MAQHLPQLFGDMRREGSKKDDRRLDGFSVYGAVAALGQVNELVVVLHETGDDRIQAEALQSLGNIVDHAVAGLHHIRRRFDILLNTGDSQVPESLQETGNTVDSSVVPLGIQFRRSYKQLVHSEGIAAVILHQIVRGNHIALGLAHLDAVLSGDHSLVEQLGEGFVKVDGTDIIQELGIETGVQKVQHRMLYTADVHVYGKVFICLFLGNQFFVVLVVDVAEEIPGRACPLGHCVGLPLCRAAADRTGGIDPLVDGGQR